jgi:NNP family nitrate/nitrite transporter-like MFS transporter
VIADKIGGIKTSIISLVFMAVGSFGILFIRNIEFCVLSMIIMAIGMGVNNAAVFKLVPKMVSNAVGGASGWVGGLGAFGGFAIPPLLGAFVARSGSDGYREGFLVFLLLAIFSIVIDIILKNMAKE